MKTLSKILVLGVLLGSIAPLQAHDSFNIEESLESFANDIPGVGLVSNTIKFDGITISNFHFANNNKVIFVHPHEEFPAYFNYKIDASQLATLHLHHFIIGLDKDGPQTCVLHNLGIRNSSGKATLQLKAPEKPGAYQVRFCHSEGLTDDKAKEAWWRGDGPSAKTIVGIVVVK